ncbi:MAG: Minf_1886 family protein [Candidatus Eisenbacteria bacterium]
MAKDLRSALAVIRKKDPRYREEAYYFLLEALDFTLSRLEAPRHLSGPELLDGIRRFAVQRFGPTSRMVFEHWGIRRTDDFGRIVFQLIDQGILSKTPADSIDDFSGVYDFKTVFEDRYSWTSE